MPLIDPFHLLGTYATPAFRLGEEVQCQARGIVIIAGLHDGPIPWPLGKISRKSRQRFLILYADLARAVRTESEQAVMRWWGVGQDTVRKWRRALGVGATTEGTSRLRSELSSDPEHVAGLKEIAARTAADPDRRAKIAAAKRGVPRPAHVREAMRQASIGRKPSDEARRNMSEAQRKRGARPPKAGRAWTAEEDALLMQLPGAEVARRTGRSISAVHSRRRKLKLPDGRRKG